MRVSTHFIENYFRTVSFCVSIEKRSLKSEAKHFINVYCVSYPCLGSTKTNRNDQSISFKYSAWNKWITLVLGYYQTSQTSTLVISDVDYS